MLKHLACPECGGKNMSELNDWTATSNEPHDRDNSGTLIEFQCRDCGRAIWLGADACTPDPTPEPTERAALLAVINAGHSRLWVHNAAREPNVMPKFTPRETHALASNGWLVTSDRAKRGYEYDITSEIRANGTYLVNQRDEIIATGREENCILAAMEANNRAWERRDQLRPRDL